MATDQGRSAPSPAPLKPVFVCAYGGVKLGKCLAGDQLVLLSDGALMRIDTLVERLEDGEKLSVPAVPERAPWGTWENIPVSRGWRNGVQPLVRVTTCSGREVAATRNHPLLAGLWQARSAEVCWLAAERLRPGDLIATPRRLPVAPFCNDWAQQFTADTAARMKVLAYHLADGMCVNGSISFTSSYEARVQDWREAVGAAFSDVAIRRGTLHGEPTLAYYAVGKKKDRRTNSLMQWFTDLGLKEKRAATKFIPPFVFTASKPEIALFLSRYLGCDGCVEQGRNGNYGVSFSSASELMLRQVAHLLLRFGAHGSIRAKEVNGITYWEWHSGAKETYDAIRKEIGLFGKKMPERAEESGWNRHDRVPLPGKSGWLTRRSAQLQGNPWGFSNLFWDEIESVTALAPAETYDIEVSGAHTFIANDILVHNSTDALMSFPRAGFLARSGALAPAHWIGYTPDEKIVEGIDGATAVLKATKVGKREPGNFPAIVVDDFSMLSEETVAKLKLTHKGSKNKYAVWDDVRQKVIDFRSSAEKAGIHVIINAHEAPPRTYEGRALRGGPRLPGAMAEDFPAACGCVLRAVAGEKKDVNLTWPGRYLCDPNLEPGWVTGDRLGIAYHGCPMNLGELLRASGYVVDRIAGVDEDAIEKASRYLQGRFVEAGAGGEEPRFAAMREVRSAVTARCAASGLVGDAADTVVRWTMRDAVDRALIRIARAARKWEYLGG